jgi:hypothetical protein
LAPAAREAVSVCGDTCFEGNSGFEGRSGAVRATTDESSGAASFFHQAKRGADWQPINPIDSNANPQIGNTLILIS